MRMEKYPGARDLQSIEFIRFYQKNFNNIDIATVDLAGTQKGILDDENTVIKMNLLNKYKSHPGALLQISY